MSTLKTTLEWLAHENAQLNRQVTGLQDRGRELVEENRQLKRHIQGAGVGTLKLAHVRHEWLCRRLDQGHPASVNEADAFNAGFRASSRAVKEKLTGLADDLDRDHDARCWADSVREMLKALEE